MSSVDQPPEILGTMIGGALVGTFLGVFLAYCVVQPIAERLKAIEETDFAFSKVIRDVIVGSTMGQPPAISVEIGRGSIPDRFRPTFAQVDEAQNSLASSS